MSLGVRQNNLKGGRQWDKPGFRGQKEDVPVEAPELAAWHAPSLAYLSEHRPSASSLLW